MTRIVYNRLMPWVVSLQLLAACLAVACKRAEEPVPLPAAEAPLPERDRQAVARSGRKIYRCDTLPDLQSLPYNDKIVCLRDVAVIDHMSMEMCGGRLTLDRHPPSHLYEAAMQAAQADLVSHCTGCEFSSLGPAIQLEIEVCVEVDGGCSVENEIVRCSATPTIGVEVTDITYVEYAYATADVNWRGAHPAEVGTPRYSFD